MAMMDNIKTGFRRAAFVVCMAGGLAALQGCASVNLGTAIGVSPETGYDANGVKTSVILPSRSNDDTIVRFKMQAPAGQADVIMVASIYNNRVTVMGTNSNDKWGRGYFDTVQQKNGSYSVINRGYSEGQEGFGRADISTNGRIANPRDENQAQANRSIDAMANIALTAIKVAETKRADMANHPLPQTPQYDVICQAPKFSWNVSQGEYWKRNATVAEFGKDGYLRYDVNGRNAQVSTSKVDVWARGNFGQTPLVSFSGSSNPMANQIGEVSVYNRATGEGVRWSGNSLVSRVYRWSPGVSEKEVVAFKEIPADVQYWREKVAGAVNATRDVGKCNFALMDVAPFARPSP